MPIQGLSETRRLPRLGKIRLGIKKTSQRGNEYPVPVDYFVLPDELKPLLGEAPKELDIMLLTNDWPEQWYKAYSKTRGLICKGNGKTATALIDLDTGEIASGTAKNTELREVNCNPDDCPLYQKAQCHRIMHFQFYVMGSENLGIYQIDTGSVNSIININSSLDILSNMTGGRIAMVPMKLKLVPGETQVEGRKKTIYILELRIDMQKLQQAMANRPGLQIVGRAALPSPDTDGAPDDLYPPDMIAESEQETEPEQPKQEKRSRGRPPKNDKDKAEKPAEQPAEQEQEAATEEEKPADVADDFVPDAPEPVASGPAPEVEPASEDPMDAVMALQELEKACSSMVDGTFFSEVVRPEMESRYDTDEFSLEQINDMREWLASNADRTELAGLVTEMRKTLDDNQIKDAAAKVIGRPKAPFTHFEVWHLRRWYRSQKHEQEAQDTDPFLSDFDG